MKKSKLIISGLILLSLNVGASTLGTIQSLAFNENIQHHMHSSIAQKHPLPRDWKGNRTNDSFLKAKHIMQYKIFTQPNVMKTIYCQASFDKRKHIDLPFGFKTAVYKKRQHRYEAEHINAAENFGRNFVEWREGSPMCVNKHGKHFRGRKCAEAANYEYRLMQADLFNLYPAIGSVNAARQNYIFTMLPETATNEYLSFGSCKMFIDKKHKKAEPPIIARGMIARTYLYFENAYPKYKMSNQQRKLMNVWDNKYPVTAWECQRSKMIENIQGNKNPILDSRCNLN